MNNNYKFETLQLHVGQEQPDPATDSRAVPIYQTTSYVFRNCAHAAARFGLTDAGNIYGRLTNSTQDVLEKRLAALEGGVAALATASGAAAISYTIQALAQAGDHIVAQKTIYGGSYNLLAHTLPQFGVSTTFVNSHDLTEVENAIQDNTKAIYLETLGNPNSDIPDIDAIAAIAHRHGLPLVIDNTFGTPYLVRPIEHGADIVLHSATKFIGGHGTTLGGIIVDSGKFDWKANGKYAPIANPNPSYHGVSFVDAVGPAAFVTYIRAILLRDTGAAISPFNAFLLLQGVETLSLRLDRHTENTKKVVEFLANHPKVEHVNHPSLPEHPDHALYEKYFANGGGSIFTFEIKGGQEEAHHGVSFVDAVGPAAFVTYIRAILLRDTGAAISPFNAFLLLQGVETLSLRLDRHTENTKKVVEFLANHPKVEHVNHPSLPEHPDHALYEKYFANGGGSIFTFEIKGGQEEAHKFIDSLEIFSLLANVADVKSLVIHPATTTHSQLSAEELLDQGIKPNTIRLSIGTEHIDDIIADLEKGFAAVKC